MKFRKTVTVLALASMMALSVAGCGKKEASGSKTNSTVSKTDSTKSAIKDAANKTGKDVKDIKVGVSIYKFDDNFMTLYRTELEKYLVEQGVSKANITIQDGKNDQAEQTNQIKNFIADGVDVMILNLVQSSSAPTVTDMAKAAGIPIVYINREPEKSEEERWSKDKIKATYVGADASQSGTFQGEQIASLPNKGDVNGDGKVSYIMIQGDPENIDAKLRTEYSVKALKDAGVEVEELLQQRADWDQAKGQEVVQNALTQFGDKVEVVFCNNDAMALGALQSIQSANRTVGKDIYLVGVDALAEVCQHVADGKVTGTVFNDFLGQSHAAADMALKYVKGEEVKPVNMVDYIKVTKENAADILGKVK